MLLPSGEGYEYKFVINCFCSRVSMDSNCLGGRCNNKFINSHIMYILTFKKLAPLTSHCCNSRSTFFALTRLFIYAFGGCTLTAWLCATRWLAVGGWIEFQTNKKCYCVCSASCELGSIKFCRESKRYGAVKWLESACNTRTNHQVLYTQLGIFRDLSNAPFSSAKLLERLTQLQ